MTDSTAAERQRRHRAHARGDHSRCRPQACTVAARAKARVEAWQDRMAARSPAAAPDVPAGRPEPPGPMPISRQW